MTVFGLASMARAPILRVAVHVLNDFPCLFYGARETKSGKDRHSIDSHPGLQLLVLPA